MAKEHLVPTVFFVYGIRSSVYLSISIWLGDNRIFETDSWMYTHIFVQQDAFPDRRVTPFQRNETCFLIRGNVRNFAVCPEDVARWDYYILRAWKHASLPILLIKILLGGWRCSWLPQTLPDLFSKYAKSFCCFFKEKICFQALDLYCKSPPWVYVYGCIKQSL